eukprot:Phypoly_transcript_05996.p1 GENE.Phypoly_transcript_05996~~Phypoly_transcript_05996.p1  ORF type:complete len:409 (+),score=53.45 Phypoly_transcript_05996:521-1747(+)
MAPILWSSLSDYFHVRKSLYVISLLVFTLASLGCCFVQDIWVLVGLRCVQAAGASATTLGAGTISDLYPVEQRGTAMGVMFFGLFIGPLIGPNIGGGLTYRWSWRATFWFCFIYAATALLGMVLFTVETYRTTDAFPSSPSLQPTPTSPLIPKDNQNEDKSAKTKADKEKFLVETPAPSLAPKRFNPIQALMFLRYPFVFVAAISTGVAFGVMFTLETILPDLFQETYGLNSWQIGLCYLGGGVGNVTGSIFGGRYIDYALVSRARARGGRVLPEDRLAAPVFVSGFVLLPVGAFFFAWCVDRHTHLSIPIVGFGLVCFGMTQVLLATSTYLVDATGKGASATAAANCVRNLFACALSFSASPMLQHTNVIYIGVLAAGLSWVVTGALIINKLKGEHWRKMAGFTQTS